MTDSISAVRLRIATIEQQINSARVGPGGTPATTTTAPSSGGTGSSTRSSSVSGAAFADVFSRVQATGADLTKYANGKIPESLLASIGGNEKLAAPAANAFNQMKADAQRAGVTFGVNDSYRSYDDQVKMAAEKGLYSQGGLAAKPGTSDHGLGIAVDLQLNGSAQAWMKQNAGKYGFVNNVAGESWHWTYKP